MSMTYGSRVFRTGLSGTSRGEQDAECMLEFFSTKRAGDKYKIYNLADADDYEAHDMFANLMGLPKPDLEEPMTDDERVDLLELSGGETITRQIVAHNLGLSVCYFAQVKEPEQL